MLVHYRALAGHKDLEILASLALFDPAADLEAIL